MGKKMLSTFKNNYHKKLKEIKDINKEKARREWKEENQD